MASGFAAVAVFRSGGHRRGTVDLVGIDDVSVNFQVTRLVSLATLVTIGCGSSSNKTAEAGPSAPPTSAPAGEVATPSPSPFTLSDPLPITLPLGRGATPIDPLALSVLLTPTRVGIGRWGRAEPWKRMDVSPETIDSSAARDNFEGDFQVRFEDEHGALEGDVYSEHPVLAIDAATPTTVVAAVVAALTQVPTLRMAVGIGDQATTFDARIERYALHPTIGHSDLIVADFEIRNDDEGLRVIAHPRHGGGTPGSTWWEGLPPLALTDGSDACVLPPAAARRALKSAIDHVCQEVPRTVQLRLNLSAGTWGPLAEAIPDQTACPLVITLDEPERLLAGRIETLSFAPPLESSPKVLCERRQTAGRLIPALVEEGQTRGEHPDLAFWRALWDAGQSPGSRDAPRHPNDPDREYRISIRNDRQTAPQNIFARAILMHIDDGFECSRALPKQHRDELLQPLIVLGSDGTVNLQTGYPTFDECYAAKVPAWNLPTLEHGPHTLQLMMGFAPVHR